MDIKYIEEFAVLAEVLSFSEASERLFISQSSLSKHIQALEKEIGMPLFLRNTRNIKLSEAGLLLLPYAQKISELYDATVKTLINHKSASESSISLGVMENPYYYDLAKYILSFHKAFPDIKVNIVEADEGRLVEMYRAGKFNMMSSYPSLSTKMGMGFIPFVESRIVAINSKSHKFSSKNSVTIEELGKEQLLIPTRNTTLAKIILDAFAKARVIPSIIYEGSSGVSLDLAESDMGISLHGIELTREKFSGSDLSYEEIEPPIKFTYGLGHKKLSELSTSEQLFVNHMRNTFEIPD